MQERLTMSFSGAKTLSDMAEALQQAAIAHSRVLCIDFDTMRKAHNVLWMIIRMRLTLTRFPNGEFSVQTFLRKPSSVISNRDFILSDARGCFGTAMQSWVLVDAVRRSVVPLRTAPELWEKPAPQPERTDRLRSLSLPPTAPAAQWAVLPEEIDKNGHLNHVNYIRHAEALVPEGCTGLEILFDCECFAGETVFSETASKDGSFFVVGKKQSGEESFRARLWKEIAP